MCVCARVFMYLYVYACACVYSLYSRCRLLSFDNLFSVTYDTICL